MRRGIAQFCFVCLAALTLGCATRYEDASLRSWNLMRDRRVDEALSIYEKDVTDEGDQLLRLMDEGMLLRVAGRFEESNQKFLKAAKIIEQSGYLSIGEQSLTLVTNEKQTTYQGEDFEKVLIHLYLSLNFMELADWDAALVEARRVNEILYKMISEEKRPYELNAFAKYVGGALFENDKDLNNALVSYKSISKIDPSLLHSFKALAMDLVRMSKSYGTSDDMDSLKKQYGENLVAEGLKPAQEKMGSLVLLFECGKSPKKYSSNESHRPQGGGGTLPEILVPVAYYQKRHFSVSGASLDVNGKSTRSVMLNDIEATAIKHLKDRMGRAVAKALLTAGVKAGIGAGVGILTNSKELGFLTGLGLMLASDADTRSWLLLPAQLQVAKIFLPPGSQTVTIKYLDRQGEVQESEKISVAIKAGKITFIQRRKFD